MNRTTTILFTAILLAPLAAGVMAGVDFPNPSLDEDVDNDKVPDRWGVPASTRVQLVTDKISHGVKAARFEDGYVLLDHNMTATNLVGLKLMGRFDAAGADGARLGVTLGYFVETNGQAEFTYARQLWDHALSEDYQTIRFVHALPPNVVRNRLWFAVYRSNQKGTIWLDNFHVFSSGEKPLTAEQKKVLTAMGREWRYVDSRLKQALRHEPDSGILMELRRETEEVLDRVGADDPDILERQTELGRRRHQIDATVNRLLSPDSKMVSWLGDAYQRLQHDEIIPADGPQNTTLLSLGTEYQALGVTVASCLMKGAVLEVEIDGLDPLAGKVEVRRQVFLMNYYDKERETVADPLPLLPEKRGKWYLALDPGETTKLYVGFKVKSGVSGDYPVRIRVGEHLLHAEIRVLPRDLPRSPLLEHFQFIYPSYSPASEHPELNAEHMAQHYVTGIEFPFLPQVVFDRDGQIVKQNLAASPQAVWMKAYTQHGIKLGLFWEGVFSRFPLENGESLSYLDEKGALTSQWKNAYTNLLRAWMDFSRQSGVELEHYWMLTDDEPASHEGWASAPGPQVRRTIELYKLTRATEPQLRQFATINDYALVPDVEALLPHLDMAMPVWPYRHGPLRNTPAGYDPHKAFLETILPMMKAERKQRGMQIWSYACAGGKKAGVLPAGRAYPVCAVGLGFTGVGYWAYNVADGSTWDDTDGSVDYLFVYNGLERHPINERYNPTGEIIVPSIRWEGFRMGMQDGQILLYLGDRLEKGLCTADTAEAIKTLLAKAEEFGRQGNYTFEGIDSISRRARQLVWQVEAP